MVNRKTWFSLITLVSILTCNTFSLSISIIQPPILANYEDSFHLELIGAFDVWKITNGSKDITIAVIDSGIDFSHHDLIGSEWINTDEIASNSIDDDGNGYIDDTIGWDFVSNDNIPGPQEHDPIHWHATFIAGIISGENDGEGVTGISPNISIMDVRVLKSDNYAGTTNEGLGDAIRYAVDNGADIISMSLQYYPASDFYYDDILYAVSQDIAVVSITGNTWQPDGGQYYSSFPGAYDEVISVGASDNSGNKADYSNYGPSTELVAPVGNQGNGIMSSVLDGQYNEGWGTSFACPQVAAAIALIKSVNETITVSQIRELLQETATDLGSPGKDDYFGYGQLNIYAAFIKLLDLKPPTPPDNTNVIVIISIVAGFSMVIAIALVIKKGIIPKK